MAKILAVDDDSTTALLVEAALQNSGHQVIHARNSEEALALAGSADLGAIILDIMMPGNSGFELLEELRRSDSLAATPILMLSSLHDSSHRVSGLRRGAADYITKPFDPDELCLRVDKLLETHAKPSQFLEGDLRHFAFGELLQSLQQGKRSGVLELPEAGSQLRLENGEILSASTRKLNGRAAALAMSSTDRGRFRFTPRGDGEKPPPSGKPFSIDGLLMSAALLEDEIDRRRAFLPEPDTQLRAVIADLPTPPEALVEVPVSALYMHLLDHPSSSLKEMFDSGLAAPIQIRAGVAWLLEGGLLEERSLDQGSVVIDPEPRIEAPEPEASLAPLPKRVLILPTADSWPGVFEALSKDARGPSGQGFKRLAEKVLLRKGGTGQVRIEDQVITVHLQIFEPATFARLAPMLSICEGLVVWFKDPPLSPAAAGILADLLAPRRQRKAMLLGPQDGLSPRLRTAVSSAPDWVWRQEPPKSLSELLSLLRG